MLPSLSGNSVFLRTFAFEILDESRVGEARRLAADLATQLEFSDVRATRVAIVVTELTTNLARHAKKGTLLMRAARQFDEHFIELISLDQGPGLPSMSFVDGVTTGTTPGTGLGAVRRQCDVFDCASSGTGTVMVCEIHATDESAAHAKQSKVRVSTICLPIAGETVAGDSWATRRVSGGIEILVVDGLGHGQLAHEAARAGVEAYCSLAPDSTIDIKLKTLHNALRSTRGAAVSIARLTTQETGVDVAYSGVGNIRAVICEPSRDRTLLTHPGTAGLQFRPRPVNHTAWNSNGAFVMHSDGLQQRWDSTSFGDLTTRHPALLAATLFRDYSRSTDDVTVVVARYGGLD